MCFCVDLVYTETWVLFMILACSNNIFYNTYYCLLGLVHTYVGTCIESNLLYCDATNFYGAMGETLLMLLTFNIFYHDVYYIVH